MKMIFCILTYSVFAFAETPQNVEDYLLRFQESAKHHMGFHYPSNNRAPKFKLGLSPFLNKDKYLGENWWFAQPKLDGQCVQSSNNACVEPTIIFDTRTWNRSGDLYREMLFFHEMGHCVLKLKHDSSDMNIMHPDGPMRNTYLINRELYHEKLFASTKREVEYVKFGGNNRRVNLASGIGHHNVSNK